MIERRVKPEILDGLDSQDPEAIAARRDLRMINFLMGNERWILRQLKQRPERVDKGIVEWGAGSGDLLRKLAEVGPARGLDLMPRPADLPAEIGWEQVDILAAGAGGGTLVANLFLHHFEAEGLRRLGKVVRQFDTLIFVEPLRTRMSLVLGRGLLPFVTRVTKHDTIVSIRAGFVPGELAERLQLDPLEWKVFERCSWRGGLRVLVSRI